MLNRWNFLKTGFYEGIMIANVKARYSNGALVPLVPLDLEEGEEVMVSIEDAPPALPSDSAEASLESRGQAIYEQRIRSRVEGTEHGKVDSLVKTRFEEVPAI